MSDDRQELINSFVRAIHDRQKVRVTYWAEKHGGNISRVCAPMDYGPFRGTTHRKGDYCHVWDYEGGSGPHQAPIPAVHLRDVEVLEEGFDPAEFVGDSWNPWWVERDWGTYS